MAGERNVVEKVLRKQTLANIERGFGEGLAFGGKPDVAAFHLGKAQHLQGLGDRQQVIDRSPALVHVLLQPPPSHRRVEVRAGMTDPLISVKSLSKSFSGPDGRPLNNAALHTVQT